MGAFEGLRVEPNGAIVAYLPAGVVRLEPDESDAGRTAGWYDWSWRGVEDPTEEYGNALEAKLDAAKVSKASVNYEDVGPTARRCALCTMFIPPAACSHVAGEIAPDGTCEDFEMRLDDAKLDEALRRADAMATSRFDEDDQKRDELGRFAAEASSKAHAATEHAIASPSRDTHRAAGKAHRSASEAHGAVYRASGGLIGGSWATNNGRASNIHNAAAMSHEEYARAKRDPTPEQTQRVHNEARNASEKALRESQLARQAQEYEKAHPPRKRK